MILIMSLKKSMVNPHLSGLNASVRQCIYLVSYSRSETFSLSNTHVKVQLMASSRLAVGISGSGITVDVGKALFYSKDPQPARCEERESSEWQAKRTVNLSHFSLRSPLIN